MIETSTTSEEQTWSMLAHLSILVNLFTAVLGPLIALIIYLVYRNQSRYIAYQSLQSLIFQTIAWLGAGMIIAFTWIITGLLSAVLIGLFLIPPAIIITAILGQLPLIAVVYSIGGAIQCYHGRDFKYLFIGDWVRGILTNK